MPRQFDIVGNLNDDTRGEYPFLVILQHDRVDALQSTIAAPAAAHNRIPGQSRLHPSFDVAGRRYVVLVEELAAVPRRIFGPVVGSAEQQRYEIVTALDLLFTGI